MDAVAIGIGLAIALGLPGFLAFLVVVGCISSLVSTAVEAGVRRGNRPDRDFRSY